MRNAQFAAADLFVLPTLAYEGFGMATLEALACGTPVVGTPVGATPEILGPLDPRLLARGVEPDALRSAVAEALRRARDPLLRSRCRVYARAGYGWDTVVHGWAEALERVAAA